ncbi:hypothetical protein P8452_27246 [Trifolium repens]|nr:hypothetical protein P8452_27246 [Trifolium repens]
MFILHLLLCPVSCFNQAQSAIPPRGLLFEEKNRLGSAPPTCHNKCNQCHPCMAVQVPNHEHVQPGHAAMKGSFFLQEDKEKPKTVFVRSQSEALNESASEKTSKPEAPKSKALKVKTSEPKTHKPQANVKSKEVLTHSRAKPKSYSKPKTFSTRVDNSRGPDSFFKQKPPRHVKTNTKGPIKVWVPKSEIMFASDLRTKKAKAAKLVPGQWLLTTYDRRKAYVPNPDSERGRHCGIWRQSKREDHWYGYSW